MVGRGTVVRDGAAAGRERGGIVLYSRDSHFIVEGTALMNGSTGKSEA